MIYLDHNATTPVLPPVVEAMLPWLRENWGNPSSNYAPGRVARRAVEEAREAVSALVGADPEQVIFTSGATEANNAALHSVIFRDTAKRHVVTSKVEHSAVLSYCEYLERLHGVAVTRLPVDSNGILNPADLRAALRSDTAVVSLMWANNETGVIWPVSEYAGICANAGIPFHTDAVQAVAKVSVSFRNTPISFLTLSGHKFGAPKGVGALVAEEAAAFLPLAYGGKQESGHRGGTENVPHIVGLGEAARLVAEKALESCGETRRLRDWFEMRAAERLPGSWINGGAANRLPNTSSIHIPGCDGDALVTYLDRKGICVSSGSACLEKAITPSHVLMAMTGSYEVANESVRISLGPKTKQEELQALLMALKEASAAIV